MRKLRKKNPLARLASDYGMLFVLLLLCVYYSFATWSEQYPEGVDAASVLAGQIVDGHGTDVSVLAVTKGGQEGAEFADTIQRELSEHGVKKVTVVRGQPYEVKREIDRLMEEGNSFDIIAATADVHQWRFIDGLQRNYPALAEAKTLVPNSYWYPNFLKRSNLMAVADRIVVIAIMAIGMTMVIITGGIDLSVGSLLACASVMVAYFVREYAGGIDASMGGMLVCMLLTLVICGALGLFSGIMISELSIPPFIVTLAMMMVASGVAFIVSGGQSIYELPGSIAVLGRGSSLFGIPNTVVLMIVLYVAGYIVMTRTVLGRYIYAVGGNIEASRLSGVPIRRVLLFVYAICGVLAGVGGIIQTSQLKSGAPTYGLTYELYVIAAVVVGGTSLAGGQGRILGTLIGAFIIAVIQNGMNLTGVESYTQKVVLGLVILAAVTLDMLKKRGINYRNLFKRIGMIPKNS